MQWGELDFSKSTQLFRNRGVQGAKREDPSTLGHTKNLLGLLAQGYEGDEDLIQQEERQEGAH